MTVSNVILQETSLVLDRSRKKIDPLSVIVGIPVLVILQ
jgi:hypothetical protein